MNALYVFLIRNDIWILFLCMLGIGWYILQLFREQRNIQRSAFFVERERAVAERNIAIIWLVIFSALAGAVVWVNASVAPRLPPEILFPATITPDYIATGLATQPAAQAVAITPRAGFPTPTPVLAPTATLAGQLRVVITEERPTRPAGLEVDRGVIGCDGNGVILQPAAGSTVTGGVSLFGRADGPNFAFYRLDVRDVPLEPSEDDPIEWRPLVVNTFDEAVNGGFLGSANFEAWNNGIYQLRLTVFNTENIEIGNCTISIGVNN